MRTLCFLVVSHPVVNRGDGFESYRPDHQLILGWPNPGILPWFGPGHTMNMNLWVAVAALWCAALTGGYAQTVLISWDVNGSNAASTGNLAGTPAASISAGTLSLGSGLAASSAASTFGGSGFDQSGLAGAITNQDYLAFTITVADGYTLNLASLEYLAGKSSGSTTLSAVLTSNRTGFTASDALDTYTFTNSSPALRSVTLAGITSLQTITGTVEFRLYGVSSSTDTFRIRSNAGADLKISGTVTAVPEPATTAAIAGAAALVGVIWLRRQRQRTAAKKPA
jgi:hypothetical protein